MKQKLEIEKVESLIERSIDRSVERTRIKLIPVVNGICLLVAIGMATGCAKSRSINDTTDKNRVVNKASEFSDGKEFHLTVGIEDADSDNPLFAVPGFSNDFGIVRTQMTENELQFRRVFDPAGRAETNSIIASFPVEHFDIVTEENDFHEKTNKIVEEKKRPWEQREFVRIDWGKPANTGFDLGAALLGDADLKEQNKTVSSVVNEKDGYTSWQVEANLSKQSSFFGMSWFDNWIVRYRTHLMPVKKGSDFQPVEYSLHDFEKFGYFYTQQNWRDPELGLLDKGIKRFAEVYNVCEPGKGLSCSTNKIVWVLSKGYPDKYLDVTRNVVREWNSTFQKMLGRNDDVVVLDESQRADMSDPRFNVIAWYANRASGGLLGVAQGVVNPVTGEKISSRATIYEDGINYVLGGVDSTIDLLVAGDNEWSDVLKASATGDHTVYETPYTEAGVDRRSLNLRRHALGRSSLFSAKVRDARFLGLPLLQTPQREIDGGIAQAKGSADGVSALKAARISKAMSVVPDLLVPQKGRGLWSNEGFSGKASATAEERRDASIWGLLRTSYQIPKMNGAERLFFASERIKAKREFDLRRAEMGLHDASLVEEATSRYLQKIAREQGVEGLKAGREKIKASIAQLTFYTTLLHEMGHTFGLRHNFKASADANHYHPEYYRIEAQIRGDAGVRANLNTAATNSAQAAAKGMPVTADDLEPYAYSSIMDYGADFYSQKGGLGPYDEAAIRYAYNRSVNKDTDPIVAPSKPYQFCTDHQVGEDLLCRQFDKGKNVSEVVKNLIERYHTRWPINAFRRGRANFDPTMRTEIELERTFIPVRQAMDEFIYRFITATTVPMANRQADSLCNKSFVFASVQRGEVKDICSGLAMERAGLDPNDLETWVLALSDDNFSAPLKSYREYTPYAFADLMYANHLAQQFFQDILSTAEPGVYVAPNPRPPAGVDPKAYEEALAKAMASDEPIPTRLVKIESDQETDEGKLTDFALRNGYATAATVSGFVKTYKPNLVDLRISRSIKPYWQRTTSVAGFETVENGGAFDEKRAALIALGLRDLGVRKYDERSFQGNAFIFPQTRGFTTALMSKIILGDRLEASGKALTTTVKVRSRDGVLRLAEVPATTSGDLQGLGLAVATLLMNSNDDTAMVDLLRICDANDRRCQPPTAGPPIQAAEFRSASNGNVYRALQNDEQNSIGFAIVKSAQEIDGKRQAQRNIIANAPAVKKAIDAAMKSADEQVNKLRQDFQLFGEMKISDVDASVAPEADGKLADLLRATITDDVTGKPLSAWSALSAAVVQVGNGRELTIEQSLQRSLATLQNLDENAQAILAQLDQAGICTLAPVAPQDAGAPVAPQDAGAPVAPQAPQNAGAPQAPPQQVVVSPQSPQMGTAAPQAPSPQVRTRGSRPTQEVRARTVPRIARNRATGLARNRWQAARFLNCDPVSQQQRIAWTAIHEDLQPLLNLATQVQGAASDINGAAGAVQYYNDSLSSIEALIRNLRALLDISGGA